MKKHFLKSFALLAMLFSALTMSAASGVDWSAYEFLGDGAGGGTYSNKYKISTAEGMSVVNIQIPGFTQEPSIYATFPAGISDRYMRSVFHQRKPVPCSFHQLLQQVRPFP